MAIEKQLGTEQDPNVRSMGSAVEIQPDTTREDQPGRSIARGHFAKHIK
jgi:hypothetical protein